MREHSPLQTKVNILIADDDDGDRREVLEALKEAELPVACVETSTIKEALAACEKQAFDCAIVDYRLPGRDGLSGITALQERCPDMAIIMVTGQGDEMVATEAMKRGASDYIPKHSITAQTLKRSVTNSLEKAALLKTIARQREDLEVFSEVLVHDLKAPISSALSFAGLIKENLQGARPDEVLFYCDKVIRGLERMVLLMDTLEQYTIAKNEIAFAPLAMQDVVADTIANLEQFIRARGAIVTCGELPTVSGTPQLIQLVQNLVSNGIKYSKAETPTVHVAAEPQDGNIWLISVRDNGIGIAEADYQKIFEPFHRLPTEARYDGTGLGLATCKKIVERHGGTIWCKSRLGEGTTFFFTLHGA